MADNFKEKKIYMQRKTFYTGGKFSNVPLKNWYVLKCNRCMQIPKPTIISVEAAQKKKKFIYWKIWIKATTNFKGVTLKWSYPEESS